MGLEILILLAAMAAAGWLFGLSTAWLTNDVVTKMIANKHEKDLLVLKHRLNNERHLLGAPEPQGDDYETIS